MIGLYLIICATVLKGAFSEISAVEQIKFDENNRLAAHTLLYHGTAACKLEVENLELLKRESVEINRDLASQFFENTDSDCSAVCIERGTHISQILNPLPYQIHTTLSNLSTFVHNKCQRAEVGFLSYAPNVCNINWVNPDGTRHTIGTLERGEKNTAWQQSYLGHVFEITDSVTNEVLLKMTVEHNGINPIGNPPSQLMERDVTQQVKNTFHMEWERAHRVKRTFTEYGFNHGRLPADLWASISAYHYNNRNNKVLEEWANGSIFVNHWESDVYFIPMPWELKKYWQSRLKTLVEAWSGAELELTDIYGMRRYEDGARLLTHVDRENTHALSLIINVAQEAVRKPWKIEVYDHADRLHEVTMDPGDIVYYESARCLHGRMQALEGAFYVNLFAHYRPIGDPQWFTKPNPADGVQPLLDIGECSLNGSNEVECTKTTPKFLSPFLDQLHGPDDLFNFWERVAPKKDASAVASHEEL